MKIALIVLLLTYIGCQDYNSNTFDQDRYGEIELIGGGEFKVAYSALQKNCMSCHRHAHWAKYTNEQDWVQNENLVVPGDAGQSQVVYRIINYGGANSDMPVGGGQISTAEYNAIKTWVETGF
jgi:hypothetical protein